MDITPSCGQDQCSKVRAGGLAGAVPSGLSSRSKVYSKPSGGLVESSIMRCDFKVLLFVLVLSYCSELSPAQGTDTKSQVLNADAIYREAVLSGDTNKLATVFADDILIVHSDGTTDTKANFLDAISSGRLKMQSYERTNVQVRVFGSVAILFSRTKKTFKYRGTPGVDVDLSTMTYLKQGSQWKIVEMQNTHSSE